MAEQSKGIEANEAKFPVERLGKHCRTLFGCSSTTFAGATAGLTGDYSVNEMEKIIQNWSEKEGK